MGFGFVWASARMAKNRRIAVLRANDKNIFFVFMAFDFMFITMTNQNYHHKWPWEN
jgi:hypothetical protein